MSEAANLFAAFCIRGWDLIGSTANSAGLFAILPAGPRQGLRPRASQTVPI